MRGEVRDVEGRCDQVTRAGAGLPAAGALLGLCVGGPVGILAGAKLGSLAALGGSILGFTGASIIREQREMRRLLLARTETEMKPPADQEVSASDRPAKRRKTVQVKEEPRVEEMEEEEVVIYPPHLLTRQWRRIGDMANHQSIVALIKEVEIGRSGGDTDSPEAVIPVNTVLVTAVVSSIPEEVT